MPDISRADEQEPEDYTPVRLTDGLGFIDPAPDGGVPVHITNPAEITISSADGAIADGVDSAIRATVAANGTTPARKELAVADADALAKAEATRALVEAGNLVQATSAKQDAQTTEIVAVKTNTQGIYDRLLALLGDAVPAPGADTLADRLKAVFTRLADESQLAKGARVVAAATAALADQALDFLRLDQFGRLRIAPDRCDPWQTQILKRGSFSSNSSSFVKLTNLTPAIAGWGAQDMEHTVTAGKTFYLEGVFLALTEKNGTESTVLQLRVDGEPVLFTTSWTPAGGDDWAVPPCPIAIPAGKTIEVWVKVSGGTQQGAFQFQGYEE